MKEEKKEEDKPLEEKILDKIINADCKLLLSGLTILAKDLSEFLAVNAYYNDGTLLFMQIFASIFNRNRHFWKIIKPQLYDSLRELEKPSGFAKNVNNKDFSEETLNALINKNDDGQVEIDEEWLRHPGWALLLAFRESFSDILLQPNGIVDEYIQSDTKNERDLILKLFKEILIQKFSTDTYWYPFTLQLSTLLVKMGLAAFFDANQNNN